ncbi:FtsX-like permease family protein [Hymenobacter aerilatus]|uniref:FtsX-like permease family protein n=1 Tax=Hymenobacter aerilatus TaxID=2932251 RepID=A0A8T9SW54_9BACT|nr:FtsX-like permease family protein [Hymenobacter aerilatus]UOR05641.1 FtsX-like permease family protein [Hymenobacter aerilatus]
MTNFIWLWRMAWRDSRRSRSRLLLFSAAIVLGIAALVGINGFGANLARSIDEQARELLGTDLVLSSSQPIDSTLRPTLDRLGRTRSREVSFASLVQFPKGQGVRLAQVRAITGGFPFYGTWRTEPESAVAQFRQATGGQRVALVDDALLAQFNAQPGDSIRVGKLTFLIAGRVRETPGQSGFSAAVAPTVFISGEALAGTGLLQRGSRVQYRTYYLFAPGTDVAKTIKPLEKRLDQANIGSDTIAERKQQTGRSFADLTRFLNLVAFVALLLGCVGVASAVSLYVREKIASVAVLRCLGARGSQALLIYLLQVAALGLAGALLGAALGTAVQLLLPRVFAEFLPVAVDIQVSWGAVAQGVLTGVLVAVLFALLPLLSIRRVSPLRTLRASFEEDTTAPDPLRYLVYGLIFVFVTGFAYLQTREVKLALGFAAGLLVALGGLAGVAAGLRWLVRRYFPTSWSYMWRQGLANLYRPNNQTLLLIISIGLGVFLMATLYITQGLLLSRVQVAGGENQPNLVLFDIQPAQRAGVAQLLTQRRLPVIQQVPIVTMRLTELNGNPTVELKKDSTNGRSRGALTREYRVTYRDSLISSEQLAEGKLPYLAADGTPHISMETGFFERLKLKLGDTLTFNVQGAPLTTIVSGTRTVDWTRVQTNFGVVFPSGVLEPAPQFYVLLTHVPDNTVLGSVQRDLVQRFPNVSAIDLGLILKTLDDILSKISFVIRFMAFFSIATGLVVLVSSVIVSRYQRVQESVLLRTLGASRRQMLRITLVEYALLGLLAAATGLVLAVLAGWALAIWVFDIGFTAAPLPLLLLAALTTVLTIVIGLFNSRDVLTRPPLAVLRGEG